MSTPQPEPTPPAITRMGTIDADTLLRFALEAIDEDLFDVARRKFNEKLSAYITEQFDE